MRQTSHEGLHERVVGVRNQVGVEDGEGDHETAEQQGRQDADREELSGSDGERGGEAEDYVAEIEGQPEVPVDHDAETGQRDTG